MNLNYSGLYKPQEAHGTKLLNSLHMNGFALDMSVTGTGKTHISSWIAKQYNAKHTIVICPRAAKSKWRNVLTQFGVRNPTIINFEKLTRGNTPYYTYKMSEYNKDSYWYESLGLKVNFPENSLIIVDEIHKCKGRNSLNMELLTAIKNSGYNVIGLSASSATTSEEMKALGYLLRLHLGHDFKAFVKEHGGVHAEYGPMIWDHEKEDSRKGIQKVHDTIFNDLQCASRLLVEDFGDIFPSNQINAELFDLGDVNSAKLQQVYDKMQYELAQLDERAQNYSAHVFAIMMKARRHAELIKVPAMVEWAINMYEEGCSPVVFCNFTDSIDSLIDRLIKAGYGDLIGKYVGGQSDKEHDEVLENFMSDKKRFMIVNKMAGNACVDMNDVNGNYPRRSLLNPSWSTFMLLQALGRIHRAGTITPCIQTILFANLPIEERMRNRVGTKLGNLELLNDGDLSLEVNLKF